MFIPKLKKVVLIIDEIFDLLLKKVTDFVPYIDNNVKLFSNKKDINISGIDNDKSKEYIVQNLLTEVTCICFFRFIVDV